jgi:hypothetical protein
VLEETTMIDFTYTVFLVVASLSGLLMTTFAVGVLGVLFYDTRRSPESLERVELQRAA